MRFKLDENLPESLREVFTRAGHDAHTVGEERLAGATDATLAAVCQAEQRAIVTFDLDFADIRTYPPIEYPGIVVLRLSSQAALHVLHVMENVLSLLPVERLAGRLWLVEDTQVRIRKGGDGA